MQVAIDTAIRDVSAFEGGGVDGIIFENNYDVPHTSQVGHETVAAMTCIGAELARHTTLPLGVSVLWNDYRAALSIAKALALRFVRVPVFVDAVKTHYGTIRGDAPDAIDFRKRIGAERVALFTDIHVKHAELLTPEPIAAAAKRAVEAQSDALIVTGKWTANAPDLGELKEVRDAVGSFPILCGSGIDEENASRLFAYADGAIVSTALKEDVSAQHAANVKPYDARVSAAKTARLVEALASSR
jgi:hypothetical protein